jgi:hypothetical protein
MSDLALLLGSVAFRDFEIPSGINFGGRQRLALHRLPGGSRVIDALGRDDAQISFSGIFSGPDATLRARLLDEMRVAGDSVPLTWDVLLYTVLISDFRADYRNGWWIPYSIACTVLRDEAWGFSQAGTSVASAARADIGTAIGYAAEGGVDLSPLQSALAASDAVTRGTSAYSTALFSLTDAQSSIASATDAADATLAGTTFAGEVSAQVGAANLITATDAAGQLSSLVTSSAYLCRTQVNLANAST